MRSVVSIGNSGDGWVLTPALQLHGKWSSKRSFSRTVMPANPDFKDLFSILNAECVEYLQDLLDLKRLDEDHPPSDMT